MSGEDEDGGTQRLTPSTLSPQAAPSREADPLARGATLGRYVLIDRLGAGGMGVVYSAYDPDLDRKVAIKIMRPDLYGDASATEGRARIVREGRALARLAHPNIVTVLDVGTYGEQVFIAMEFVAGPTLQ